MQGITRRVSASLRTLFRYLQSSTDVHAGNLLEVILRVNYVMKSIGIVWKELSQSQLNQWGWSWINILNINILNTHEEERTK